MQHASDDLLNKWRRSTDPSDLCCTEFTKQRISDNFEFLKSKANQLNLLPPSATGEPHQLQKKLKTSDNKKKWANDLCQLRQLLLPHLEPFSSSDDFYDFEYAGTLQEKLLRAAEHKFIQLSSDVLDRQRTNSNGFVILNTEEDDEAENNYGGNDDDSDDDQVIDLLPPSYNFSNEATNHNLNRPGNFTPGQQEISSTRNNVLFSFQSDGDRRAPNNSTADFSF